MTTKPLEYHWEVLGTDLFELKGKLYLLVSISLNIWKLLDVRLTTITSSSVIRALKMIFS